MSAFIVRRCFHDLSSLIFPKPWVPPEVLSLPTLEDIGFRSLPDSPAPVAESPVHGQPFSLRVLSLNIWGLPVAPYLEQRVAALAERLASGVDRWDVCAFQEAWFDYERDLLSAAGKKAGLKYSYYFAMGIGIPLWPGQYGTGLFVLSRYPIIDSEYLRFPVNGKPYKIWHGDYYGAKGCGLCRVLTPVGLVDVFVTHLLSCYAQPDEFDEYEVNRVAQVPPRFVCCLYCLCCFTVLLSLASATVFMIRLCFR